MTTIEARPGTMDADIISEMQRGVYHVADYVRDGDWVVDVGAYIGAFAVHVKNHCPGARLLCIEPMPSNFPTLVQNAGDIAITEQVALTGKAEPITLYDFGLDASACHSIYDLGVDGATAVEVTGMTLAQVLDKHGIDRVRFLKSDCQGAEFDIFPNTPSEVLSRVDYIAMEVHHAISKTGVQLGEIPEQREKKRRLFTHLQKTHVPVHGDLQRGSVQVWCRRGLRKGPLGWLSRISDWF